MVKVYLYIGTDTLKEFMRDVFMIQATERGPIGKRKRGLNLKETSGRTAESRKTATAVNINTAKNYIRVEYKYINYII